MTRKDYIQELLKVIPVTQGNLIDLACKSDYELEMLYYFKFDIK